VRSPSATSRNRPSLQTKADAEVCKDFLVPPPPPWQTLREGTISYSIDQRESDEDTKLTNPSITVCLCCQGYGSGRKLELEKTNSNNPNGTAAESKAIHSPLHKDHRLRPLLQAEHLHPGTHARMQI
jgi:hypothetical protein